MSLNNTILFFAFENIEERSYIDDNLYVAYMPNLDKAYAIHDGKTYFYDAKDRFDAYEKFWIEKTYSDWKNDLIKEDWSEDHRPSNDELMAEFYKE